MKLIANQQWAALELRSRLRWGKLIKREEQEIEQKDST